MLNTLQTFEMANVSTLLSSTWKHDHKHWSPNLSQWFIYEAIMKYVIQGQECVKQGLNPICVKFPIFPKVITGVPFLERSKYHFSQFYPLLSLPCLNTLIKPQHLHYMPLVKIEVNYWYCIIKIEILMAAILKKNLSSPLMSKYQYSRAPFTAIQLTFNLHTSYYGVLLRIGITNSMN